MSGEPYGRNIDTDLFYACVVRCNAVPAALFPYLATPFLAERHEHRTRLECNDPALIDPLLFRRVSVKLSSLVKVDTHRRWHMSNDTRI